MSETDRYSRGKTRLLYRENAYINERNVLKKLGKIPPEELVKPPKIGEWKLDSSTTQDNLPSLSLPKGCKPFPAKIPLNQDQINRITESKTVIEDSTSKDTPKILAPLKVRAPTYLLALRNIPIQKIEFPPGTSSTQISNILNAKKKHPVKPFPSMKDTIDDGKFLPLEFFDDSTYEEYPLEILMENPVAFSQYSEIEGDIKWEPCHVLGKEGRYFLIQWDNHDQVKKVTRFNIRFDKENEELLINESKLQKRMLPSMNSLFDTKHELTNYQLLIFYLFQKT